MATLTGQTISSTYDGLLKTTDNDVLNADGKEITDGLGNGSGVSLDTNGNIVAQGTVKAIGGIKDTSDDLGTSGQVLSSTGSGTNWIDPSIADDSVTYAKLAAQYTEGVVLGSGEDDLDFSLGTVFTKTISGATTLTFSNVNTGDIKLCYFAGDAPTFPTGFVVGGGEWEVGSTNIVQIAYTGSVYLYTINQLT